MPGEGQGSKGRIGVVRGGDVRLRLRSVREGEQHEQPIGGCVGGAEVGKGRCGERGCPRDDLWVGLFQRVGPTNASRAMNGGISVGWQSTNLRHESAKEEDFFQGH